MATYTKLSSSSWCVQVRRKYRYVSETFLRRDDARRWAIETERQLDGGKTPTKSRVARLKTFGELMTSISTTCAMYASPLAAPVVST
ncbi:hypothetical protein P9272_25390 [Mesorhizobium sp. WSM4976]|uniref:hypothetical protein n=1 Tax=Mesorhizobium sp. WSM4976 TaxID=3038549 RepID=UPI0024176B61|nr:hypothetical protein [Mesorhizobium sp. WSM4976]MDG4896905.1 hypothetical protein [Mesorhizobium sp. WSM4976]